MKNCVSKEDVKCFSIGVDFRVTPFLSYENSILPEIRDLLGRDPMFGDEWWNRETWKKFNGSVWIAI